MARAIEEEYLENEKALRAHSSQRFCRIAAGRSVSIRVFAIHVRSLGIA